jgi:4-alpha-glucanotransferase
MDESLRALAKAAGLATAYEDARGERQEISPDVVAAVLDRLGLPADDAAARRASLARLDEESAPAKPPPLVTAEQGAPVSVRGRGLSGRYEIELADGRRLGGAIERRRGKATLQPIDVPGYHVLRIGEAEATIAVAPPRCYWPEDDDGRSWGVAAQIYGLRRPGDGGIGDFSAVADLAEASARMGASALAISPVHAMFSADPGRASPYSPSNRLLLNGLLVDPAARFGKEAVAAAAAALGQPRASWETSPLIDWDTAGKGKLELLRRLFDGMEPGSGVATDFAAWRERAGDSVMSHALFETLHDALRGEDGHPQHWRAWGEAYAGPGAPGVEASRRERADDVAFHAFLQWLALDGLQAAQARARDAGMAIGLIADLAVGADGGGSQAWARRDDMLTGLHMGAPPDNYNAKGQDWGLAALDPHALRRSGFRAFLEMLRASLSWAGGVRIDHILGLHRIWVIPEGAPPTEGAYLHFPLDDLLRLVTLESALHRAIVIGEDLGTVPGGLRRKLADRRILGMSVLWFEQQGGRFLQPRRWRAESAAMTTTHDLPTVAGWWSGRDLAWKEELDLYPSAEAREQAREERAAERRKLWSALRRAGAAAGAAPAADPEVAPVDPALAFVARTPCRLALAPIEDLLAAVEQPNLPGTVDEHPNWRRRLPEGARLGADPAMKERLARFASDRARE